MKMKHVTIHTAKMEESIRFYESAAGLSIQGDLRGKGGPDIVFLAGGEGETCIELISDPEGYTGEGLSIGFAADDVIAHRQHLIDRGLTVTPIISPVPDVTFFFTKDPNGVEVQFI